MYVWAAEVRRTEVLYFSRISLMDQLIRRFQLGMMQLVVLAKEPE